MRHGGVPAAEHRVGEPPPPAPLPDRPPRRDRRPRRGPLHGLRPPHALRPPGTQLKLEIWVLIILRLCYVSEPENLIHVFTEIG